MVAAEKSFLRAMSFESGQYKVRGIASDKQFDDVLDDDFDALLKKADEHASQMRKFREVIPDGFPPLQLAKPLEARLAELSDELLDTFQLVINEGEIEAVVNASSASMQRPTKTSFFSYSVGMLYLSIRFTRSLLGDPMNVN